MRHDDNGAHKISELIFYNSNQPPHLYHLRCYNLVYSGNLGVGRSISRHYYLSFIISQLKIDSYALSSAYKGSN
jgi:hypothetical protein